VRARGEGTAALMKRMARDERGQVLPVLLFLMLMTLAGGWALLEVGKASVDRSTAQNAADAAALAGTRNVRDQIRRQLTTTGTVNLLAIDDAEVSAAAASYAAKNDAKVTDVDRLGVDVLVKVRSNGSAGAGDEAVDVKERHSEARARASMSFLGMPGVADTLGGITGAIENSGGGGGGSVGGASFKMPTEDEWADLAKDIGSPPFSSSQLVKLGRFLVDHGLNAAENPAFGGVAPVHEHYGVNDHYHGGAIDFNVVNPGPGDSNEAAVFDRLEPKIAQLGFQVLWRVPNHAPGDNSHMHVDIGPGGRGGGAVGGGAGGGGGLGLGGFPLAGDSTAEIKLVPWEGGPSLFAGIDPTSGNPFGAPDLSIACKIVSYASAHHLSDRVLLAGMEAAIVESGVHNLGWGDRDSLGVFQQRPSVGAWGTGQQILNVDHAIMAFFRAAVANDHGQPAGELAQDTQVSAFPDRYAAVEGRARELINQMDKSCDDGNLLTGA
jgi:Putative Flp pilus-assembly TadE/G-like